MTLWPASAVVFYRDDVILLLAPEVALVCRVMNHGPNFLTFRNYMLDRNAFRRLESTLPLTVTSDLIATGAVPSRRWTRVTFNHDFYCLSFSIQHTGVATRIAIPVLMSEIVYHHDIGATHIQTPQQSRWIMYQKVSR